MGLNADTCLHLAGERKGRCFPSVCDNPSSPHYRQIYPGVACDSCPEYRSALAEAVLGRNDESR